MAVSSGIYVVSLVSIHGDVWRFSMESICSVVSRWKIRFPQWMQLVCSGSSIRIGFLHDGHAVNNSVPQKGQNLGLVDRLAADLMPFDAESVGDEHPGPVSL